MAAGMDRYLGCFPSWGKMACNRKEDMDRIILISALIIFLCVVFNKISSRIGVPMLLAFIALGMVFGVDGIFKVDFEDYRLVSDVSTLALTLIMFYGGFSTNVTLAKPVALQAILLSTLGVLATAMITGLFCRFVIGMDWITGFLMGSVVASTDAASVFSVLRSKRLSLRNNTASLLEVESGSNDPAAYMLTIVLLQIKGGGGGAGFIVSTIALQFCLGIALGVGIAFAALYIMRRMPFGSDGFDMIFVLGVALVSYALPAVFGGNGFLSTYITGLILGNAKIYEKKRLVLFFDGITGLMQILLFFLLGLLATPSRIPDVAWQALLIMLFLTFLARPVVVAGLLAPFGCSLSQILLVSFAGLRGAASIVFAILAIMRGTPHREIFHIAFFIVLLSILFQGTLLPWVSRKLDMIDEEEDVLKTFTDYSDALPVQFIQFRIPPGHPWTGASLADITLPPDTLLVYRENAEGKTVPDGQTVLEAGDKLVLSANEPEDVNGIRLTETHVNKKHSYAGKKLAEIPKEDVNLIILIKRGNEVIIPWGDTEILPGDTLICNELMEEANG